MRETARKTEVNVAATYAKVRSIWISVCLKKEERGERKHTSADFLRGHLDRLVGVAKVDLDTV